MKFSKTKPLSFGFIACLEDDVKINTNIDFVPMGKERSMFKVEMEILERKKSIEECNIISHLDITAESSSSPILKCLLLSDARLCDEDIRKLYYI